MGGMGVGRPVNWEAAWGQREARTAPPHGPPACPPTPVLPQPCHLPHTALVLTSSLRQLAADPGETSLPFPLLAVFCWQSRKVCISLPPPAWGGPPWEMRGPCVSPGKARRLPLGTSLGTCLPRALGSAGAWPLHSPPMSSVGPALCGHQGQVSSVSPRHRPSLFGGIRVGPSSRWMGLPRCSQSLWVSWHGPCSWRPPVCGTNSGVGEPESGGLKPMT